MQRECLRQLDPAFEVVGDGRQIFGFGFTLDLVSIHVFIARHEGELVLEEPLGLEPHMDLVKGLRKWRALIDLILCDTSFFGAALGQLGFNLWFHECLES